MKRTLILAISVLVASTAALAGCSSSEPEPTATPTTPSPSPSPTPTVEPAAWPLTGLPTDGDVEQPVIGVKVENSRFARPQTGIEHADIVFVEMVEGGTTRFHVIFNSVVPDVVGPVRSLRPMDAAILGQWSAPLVYSGGTPEFEARVASAGIQLIVDSGVGKGFFRSIDRRSPHNLYADMLEVLTLLDGAHAAPPSPMFRYGVPSSAAGGSPVAWARAQYPSVRSGWEWDAATGTFERFDDGAANWSVDQVPVAAANVLVLRVEIRDTGSRDSANQWVPETILTGSGELVLFGEGAMVEGTWSKGGDNDPFEFTDAAGEPLLLTPGTTWVELLPVDSTLTTG